MDLLSVNDTTICNDEQITIIANNGFINYTWNTNANTQGININFPGTYTVTSSYNTNNLVTNGGFSNGNNGFSSAYTYNATSLWNEGTYSVTSNANNVHSGFTGTGAGNFLVVNGSTNPGSQVWCQEITVTANTLYNFSTIVNTVAGVGNPALLQFSINGNTIGSQFTAPSSINTWEEFNATWNSGTNTSAEICIVNQNISGSGNDFGLDNITFTTLCTASESITVTEGTQANATIFSVDDLCETGSSITLNAVEQNGIWSGNGITNPNNGTFSPSISGDGEHIISYTISSVCGDIDTVLINVLEELESNITGIDEVCVNGDPIYVEGIPGPGIWSAQGIINPNDGLFNPLIANIGENTIIYTPSLFCVATSEHLIEVHDLIIPDPIVEHEICYSETVELELSEGNFNSYLWSNNSTNRSLTVNASGSYNLQFSDEHQCEQEITFIVLDKDDCEIITMPNVFTPNNDLTNDLFIPLEYEFVSHSTMKIFNRWGTIIWNTDEIEKGWNGKHFQDECSEGVYFWLIEYKTNKDTYKTLSGNVSLFR
jgi:gliding motility-associated-like protein